MSIGRSVSSHAGANTSVCNWYSWQKRRGNLCTGTATVTFGTLDTYTCMGKEIYIQYHIHVLWWCRPQGMQPSGDTTKKKISYKLSITCLP